MSAATTELVRVGFFREMRHAEPSDPALAAARRDDADPDEAAIAAYLDAGHVMVASPGATKDVLDPAKRTGPPHYMTDGRYLWPGDVAHYVRTYHVALPADFIDHMRSNGWRVPAVDLARVRRPAPPPAPSPSLLLGELARTLASATAADHAQAADAFRAAMADAGVPIADPAALPAELRRALTTAVGAVQAQVADAAARITAWLDHPDAATTAQVQALVDRFEAATADQAAADRAERQRGHQAEAGSSIAARLRARGVAPGSGPGSKGS
jgi:hypothetical protein